MKFFRSGPGLGAPFAADGLNFAGAGLRSPGMRTRTWTRRLGLIAALALAGCAGTGQSAISDEAGASLGRLRDTIVNAAENTGGRAHSLSPHMMFATLRRSIATLPESFRLRATFLPAPSDLGRLLAPPNSGWKAAGLGERVVGRFRF